MKKLGLFVVVLAALSLIAAGAQAGPPKKFKMKKKLTKSWKVNLKAKSWKNTPEPTGDDFQPCASTFKIKNTSNKVLPKGTAIHWEIQKIKKKGKKFVTWTKVCGNAGNTDKVIKKGKTVFSNVCGCAKKKKGWKIKVWAKWPSDVTPPEPPK